MLTAALGEVACAMTSETGRLAGAPVGRPAPTVAEAMSGAVAARWERVRTARWWVAIKAASVQAGKTVEVEASAVETGGTEMAATAARPEASLVSSDQRGSGLGSVSVCEYARPRTGQ